MAIIYTETQISIVQQAKVPRHVAIIMDGNRRWAQEKNPLRGHWAGAKVVLDIVQAASELGVKVVTLYGFSTENWSRSQAEVELLIHIFETYLRENRQRMVDQGVRFHVIGDLTPFPERLKSEVRASIDATKNEKSIDLVVALNYGGRDELRRALGKMIEACRVGKLDESQISEETIADYLDTAGFGDLDLLIRTSGEMRVSNFLLWQLAYAEIYVTQTLWPDFSKEEFYQAILSYQRRRRRIGM